MIEATKCFVHRIFDWRIEAAIVTDEDVRRHVKFHIICVTLACPGSSLSKLSQSLVRPLIEYIGPDLLDWKIV